MTHEPHFLTGAPFKPLACHRWLSMLCCQEPKCRFQRFLLRMTYLHMWGVKNGTAYIKMTVLYGRLWLDAAFVSAWCCSVELCNYTELVQQANACIQGEQMPAEVGSRIWWLSSEIQVTIDDVFTVCPSWCACTPPKLSPVIYQYVEFVQLWGTPSKLSLKFSPIPMLTNQIFHTDG